MLHKEDDLQLTSSCVLFVGDALMHHSITRKRRMESGRNDGKLIDRKVIYCKKWQQFTLNPHCVLYGYLLNVVIVHCSSKETKCTL
jgi:hypothetical protein